MVTQLLQAMTFDVMNAVKDDGFFDCSQAERDEKVASALPNYPKSLTKYLRSCNESEFVDDASILMKSLGAGGSILPESARFVRSGNQLFIACLDAVKGLQLGTSYNGELGALMNSFSNAGPKYERVIKREMQLLLLMARDEDSPIVQIAAEVDVDTSALPGIPDVQINRQLLGGSRMFYNGKLTDNSWRSRLTKVLSQLS